LRRHLSAQLSLVEAADGRFDAAVRAAADALDPEPASGADEQDAPGGQLGVTAARVALAWVLTERGDLAAAVEHVHAAWVDHDGLADPVCAASLALVRSRLMRLGGDLEGALRVLVHRRDRRGTRPPSWLVLRLEAAEVSALLADGRPEAAEALVRRFTVPDAPEGLLAHGWVKLATGAAAESRRTARQVSRQTPIPVELLVEANLLGAASALALSRPDAAAAGVDEALRLAAAEGLRRLLDEGPERLRALVAEREHHLRSAPAADPTPAREAPVRALPASGARRGGRPTSGAPSAAVPPPRTGGDLLLQPLTEREHEVLTYLDQLLPTDEIAARMFVSVNTVKTHVRAILRKLAAERRNEAVRRARELGLV
jgi:LuxR family maltose regulon positive regulatory protein